LVIDEAQTLCPEFRKESFEPTYRLKAVKANSVGLAPQDNVIQACSKIRKTAKENPEESNIEA
jgi:hypothetical protein